LFRGQPCRAERFSIANVPEQRRQALLQLAAATEQAVPFVQTRLKPVTPQNLRRIAALIADLDHAGFAVRQQASEEIVKLAEPALRRVLNDKPPVEVQRRAEAILLRLEGPVTSPEQLRALRGIEALEQAETGATAAGGARPGRSGRPGHAGSQSGAGASGGTSQGRAVIVGTFQTNGVNAR
jgi:hypothetical protein